MSQRHLSVSASSSSWQKYFQSINGNPTACSGECALPAGAAPTPSSTHPQQHQISGENIPSAQKLGSGVIREDRKATNLEGGNHSDFSGFHLQHECYSQLSLVKWKFRPLSVPNTLRFIFKRICQKSPQLSLKASLQKERAFYSKAFLTISQQPGHKCCC